jgi:hypothetical protein
MVIRKTPRLALVVGAALAIGAPTAAAQTPVSPGFAFPPGFESIAPITTAWPAGLATGQQCGTNQGPIGQASTAGTNACTGPGLSFVGPAIGQVASVIGPTIIGPAVVGTLIVSAGAAAGAP